MFEGSTKCEGAGCAAASAEQKNKQPSEMKLQERVKNPGMRSY